MQTDTFAIILAFISSLQKSMPDLERRVKCIYYRKEEKNMYIYMAFDLIAQFYVFTYKKHFIFHIEK